MLGIRHRWEPQPLYDIWAKMDLEWFAQQIGADEWYIFVHRPAVVHAFAIRAVIGAEVGSIPPTEVVARLQVLAEQLQPGQTLEATGLGGDRVAETATALRERLGGDFAIDAAHTLTITRGVQPEPRMPVP